MDGIGPNLYSTKQIHITAGKYTIYAQLITSRVGIIFRKVTKTTTYSLEVTIDASKVYVLYYDSTAKAVLLKEKGV